MLGICFPLDKETGPSVFDSAVALGETTPFILVLFLPGLIVVAAQELFQRERGSSLRVNGYIGNIYRRFMDSEAISVGSDNRCPYKGSEGHFCLLSGSNTLSERLLALGLVSTGAEF